MAEIDAKLSDEIAEWQRRMQQFLVDQSTVPQAPVAGVMDAPVAPQVPPVAQNGAPPNDTEHDTENIEERASSQQRE